MGTSRQLTIPDHALKEDKSFEVARVWIVDNAPHVSLRIGVQGWEDPGVWGILLADLARHVAIAFEQDKGLNKRETLERVRSMLTAELNSPTDDPRGTVLTM